MRHAKIAGAILFAARVAAAQPAGAQAEILFRQARELLAAGKIAEACDAFAASEKLDPTASTLLNLAACRERNNQLATAWGLFLEAERETRSGNDATTKQLHKAALDHASALEPRLSTLAIGVPDDARVRGLEVLRDKDVVDVGAWNKALPIDGGTYRVTARAPGNSEWSTTVTVGPEHDAKSIEIPTLKAADLRPPEPVPVPPKVEAPAPVEDDAPPPSRSPSRLPYYVGGGALVGLGAALAFELAGESTYDNSKAERDPSKQRSLWHTANSERYLGEALAVAGVGAAGAAVWLYVRDRRGVVVTPAASGDRVGIQIMGGF